MNKRSNSFSIFQAFNYVFMCIICLAFVYPFVYTIAISFSSPEFIIRGDVLLFPRGWTLSAYQAIFRDSTIISSFIFTVELTLFGVIGSIVATTMTAYPLSKKDLKGKNIILNLIIFTMYFSGGIIPTYFVIKDLGLMDKMGSLILPVLISSFLLFIMINYFRGLPAEIEESAKIDGAGSFRILLEIIIPLSMPIIATLTIYYAVSYWNTFFSAILYIQTESHYPLQIKLYMILNNTELQTNSNDISSSQVIPENLKGAVIIITALPILLVYPFLQKHFIKGVTIGAIKG